MNAMDRLLAEGIKPYADRLAEIMVTGAVAVVVFKPQKFGRSAARELGWDGKAPVFELREPTRRWFSALSDAVTAAWLESGREGRIFVIAGYATLLANYVPGKGFMLEPGSTDAERI